MWLENKIALVKAKLSKQSVATPAPVQKNGDALKNGEQKNSTQNTHTSNSINQTANNTIRAAHTTPPSNTTATHHSADHPAHHPVNNHSGKG